MRLVVLYAYSTLGSFSIHLPFALSRLAQAVEDNAIAYFGLTVALRRVGGGEPVGDLVFGAEVRYLLAKLVPLSEMMV